MEYNTEELNRAILEGIPDIINLIDIDGVYLGSISKNDDRDLVPQNINRVGKNITELLPVDIASSQIQAIQRALATHQPQMFEQQVTLRGCVQYEEVRVIPTRSDAALVIIRDISDRKYAEQELLRKQSFFAKVLSVNPNEIYVYDLIEQRHVYVNSTFSETWGYTPEDLQRMGTNVFRHLVHPDDYGLLEQHHQQCLMLRDNERIELEYRFRHANGEWQWIQIRDTSFCRAPNGKVQQILGSAQDITERKQVEEKLRKSEMALAEAQRIAQVGNWHFEVATGKVTWSREMFRIFGLDPDRLAPTLEELDRFIHPDDQAYQQQIIAEGIARKQPYEFECRIIHTDGSVRYTLAKGEPIINDQGELIQLFGTSQDISDRKQSEAKLQRQYQQAKLFSEVTLKIRQSFQLEEILQTTVEEIQKIIQADRVLVYRVFADGTGKVVSEAVLTNFTQVLGREFPEEVFPEEYQKFYSHGCVRAISDIDDPDSGITECLVEFSRDLQVKAKLIVPILISKDSTIASTSQNSLWGLLIAHQCSKPRQWNDSETELLGQLSSQLGIAIVRSQLMADLRNSEEKYRHLIDNLHAGFVVHAPDTSIVLCNSNACNLLGLTLDQMMGKTAIDPVWHFFHEDGTAMSLAEYPVNQVLNTGLPLVNYVTGVNRCDRTQVWLLVNAFPEFDTIHQIEQIVISFIDITDRKDAEIALQQLNQELERRVEERTEKIQASLKEKEVMLKEIHHRVKNNLQMVSSLLSLQASYIDDHQVLSLFSESQSRIQVIALIHEKLYRSNDLAEINLNEYLTDLVIDLFQYYGDSKAVRIDYQVDVADIDLAIEQAIPCGLIVNELVSNAIKHAFPNRTRGEIYIHFSRNNRDKDPRFYLLSVGDNGIDFPQDLDFRNTESLGFQIVCALTSQLRGKVELKNGEGCRFEISFPTHSGQMENC